MTQDQLFSLLQMTAASGVTWLITYLATRKEKAAATLKVQNESGDIVLKGEIQMSEFYQKQWNQIRLDYEELKRNYLTKEKQHNDCENNIQQIRHELNNVKREVTLMRSQIKPS